MFHYEDIVTENNGRFRVYCKSYRVHLDAFLGSIYPDAAWLRQHLCAVMGEEILFFCGNISLYRSIVRPGGLIFPVMLPFTSNVPAYQPDHMPLIASVLYLYQYYQQK